MDDLLEILSSVNYQDYGSLQLTGMREMGANVRLRFEAIADEHPDLPRDIEITAIRVVENLVSVGCVLDFQTSQDHVLLWHYTKPFAAVSFYGQAADALAVLGALYERHIDLVEDWLPFHKYMNPEVRMKDLLAGSFGMLADGPEPLVLAYEEVMQDYGFTTSHHPSPAPRGGVGESADLSVLLLDDSHVIASAFVADAVDTKIAR